MKIFVVGGKSGSGKNEVAKMIEEFYIYKLQKCVITEFSKYIKNFARELAEKVVPTLAVTYEMIRSNKSTSRILFLFTMSLSCTELNKS